MQLRVAAHYNFTMIVLAVLASMAAVVRAEADETADCAAVIDGHVVDAETHEPIAAVTVWVNGEAVEIADAEGRFHLSGLCPGEYLISVMRDDYEPGAKRVMLKKFASMEIALSPGLREVILVESAIPREVALQSETVVAGDALERSRGRSFSDVLEAVPGVTQLGSGTGLGKPIVRGQFGRRLALVVDGARHRSQNWGIDHAPEVDPFIADEIAVVRGAAGVRYGPDAIGGAVVARSRPLPVRVGSSEELYVFGVHRRGGGAAARIEARSSRWPELAVRVEGSGKRLAAPLTPDYALHNTGSLEWSIGGAIGYQLETSDLQFSYRRYQAELGVCACLRIESIEDFRTQLDRERPVDAEFYRPDLDIGRPKQTVTHDTAALSHDARILAVGTLETTYTLQIDRRREFDVVRAATGPQFDFDLWTHELATVLDHKPIHLTDHLHARGTIGVTAMGQNHDFAGFSLIPDYRAWAVGVYAVERLVGHDYEVEAGVRYDRLRRSAFILRDDFTRLVRSDQLDIDACGSDDGTRDPVECGSTFDTVSASLGGIVEIADPWSVKLSLATASRPPNPDEQYLNGTSPTSPVLGLGKPDIDPETTYSASLTSTFQTPSFAVEASIHASFIDDYIYFAPAIDAEGEPIFDVLSRGAFPRFVIRPVDAVFYGGDGGLSWRPLAALELQGQLSIVRARNVTDSSYLAFVPPDRLRGSARYMSDFCGGDGRLSAAVIGTFVRRQDRFDRNADLAPPPDAYFTLGAELEAKGEVFGRDAAFAVIGTNLLNARYRDYTSLLRYFADQPGWQLMIRLSASLERKER